MADKNPDQFMAVSFGGNGKPSPSSAGPDAFHTDMNPKVSAQQDIPPALTDDKDMSADNDRDDVPTQAASRFVLHGNRPD